MKIISDIITKSHYKYFIYLVHAVISVQMNVTVLASQILTETYSFLILTGHFQLFAILLIVQWLLMLFSSIMYEMNYG